MIKGFSHPKRIALEGEVIGFWEILDYVGCDGRRSWYRCRCSKCGMVKLIRSDKLRTGRTKQCADCRAAELNKKSCKN